MYLTVDIGGSKTLVAVFGKDGDKLEESRFPTPKNYQTLIKMLADTVASFTMNEFVYAAVAAPGKIDRATGTALAFGNLPWSNVPLKDDLEKHLDCPVVIENDANLAGLSEALLLGSRYRQVLYITISTGIGAGFVVDGNIDPSTADMEVGFMPIEHEGKVQRWENFASGQAIYNEHKVPMSKITDHEALKSIARNIAVGLIDLVATLTPDIIIIGGGAGKYYDKYKTYLEEALDAYNSPMLNIPPVIKAKRPEEAVIYGCYEFAKRYYEKHHQTTG